MAASSAVEDLEYNEFYKLLQTQFQALYDRAQSDCWLVCIPISSSLPPSNQINYNFVSAHLLEPSKLYRDEFSSLLVGGKKRKWRLENDRLNSEDETLSVQVLSEELAYNKSLKHYRMFIVSSPLIEGVSKRKKKVGVASEDLTTPRRTVLEHLNFLSTFQKHIEIKHEIDKRIAMFRDNYMVLEGFLTDAANRIETLVKQGYSSYTVEHSTDKRLQDRRVQEMVWLALESYITTQLHSKVYPKICNRHSKEDKYFIERCRQLRPHLVPRAVDIPAEYNCHYNLTLCELSKLKECTSSLAKLQCLQDALDSIQIDVQNHFKSLLRLGEPSPLPSDDLISLLATIIVQAKLNNFPSDVYYMEYFHWSFTDGEKLSFVLVTVRAALEYIRGPDVERFLPKSTTTTTSSVRHNSYSHPSPPFPISHNTSTRLHRIDSFPSSSTSSSTSSSSRRWREEEVEERQEELSLDDTLLKLTRLKCVADEMDRKERQPSQKKEEKQTMGPFFDQLMKQDGVMSSADYSTSPYKWK